MSQLLVQLSHIYHTFGPLSLFEDISLSIHEGEIFALIGENGAGKTTLLQLLRGTFTPESGTCIRASNLVIGFLPQEVTMPDPTVSVRSYIEQGPLSEVERQMTECLEAGDRLLEWEELHRKYELLGGYRRIPVEKVLKGLKLEKSLLDCSMGQLSSGQRVRAALAKALIENPLLLLLDEPTNHLDAEMLDWLKSALKERDGATVVISHDRQFINSVCDRLIELKGGKLTSFGGNYDFYLAEKDRILEKEMKAYEGQEEERGLLRQKIKALSYSKGKPTPPSDRNIMAYDYRGGNHQKSVQHTLNELKNRLAEIEAHPLAHPKPKSITGLKFFETPLASSVAVELEQVGISFGEKALFTGFTQLLCQGDRIILRGVNGAGKTTLLRCIAGLNSTPYVGTIRLAPTVKIGYLDQEVEDLPLEATPLEYFAKTFQMTEEELRRELHKAAIGGAELIKRPFGSLSVGQRKRLRLLSLVLEKPNVLLLDEPTNHLDLLTLEALEKSLQTFKGAILAVSHDQTFIAKIATKEWSFDYQ